MSAQIIRVLIPLSGEFRSEGRERANAELRWSASLSSFARRLRATEKAQITLVYHAANARLRAPKQDMLNVRALAV
jgi:hypothetical protein